MPIPAPGKDQKEDEYISSCMSNSVMMKEYKDNKQRYAICKSTFDRQKKKKAKGEVETVNFEDNIINDILLID